MTRAEKQKLERVLADIERRGAGQPTVQQERSERSERIRRCRADFGRWCKTYIPHHVPVAYPKHILALATVLVLGYKQDIGRLKAEEEIAALAAANKTLEESEFCELPEGVQASNYMHYAWQAFRGCGKTTFLMAISMWWMYHDMPFGLLVASYDEEKAEGVLDPIAHELRDNQLYQDDSGHKFVKGGKSAAEFATTKGCPFFAFGSRQNPRSTKYKNRRPTLIVGDDLDDDKVVRNEELVEKVLDWWNSAVLGTPNPDQPYRRLMLGNVIHPKSVLKRYGKQAEVLVTKFNLLDGDGQCSWPQRFSKKAIDDLLTMPDRLFRQEYLNDPKLDGEIWKDRDFRFRAPRPLQEYSGHVLYGDSAFADRRRGDYMAWIHLARLPQPGGRDQYDVLRVFLRKVESQRDWVQWMLRYWHDLGDARGLVHPWYEAGTNKFEALELLFEQEQTTAGIFSSAQPDKRAKPNKQQRIRESHAFFGYGQLHFAKHLEADDDTLRLIEQYKNFRAEHAYRNQVDDGPDAVEGGLYLLQTHYAASSFDPVFGDAGGGSYSLTEETSVFG